LKLIETYLDDPALQREAYSAYERIAEAIAGQQPAAAAAALQRVADKAPDNGLKNRATKALEKIKK
jgi:DNA-binding FadR family transcriptional regulator